MARNYKTVFIVTLFFSWFTFFLSAQTQVQGTIKDDQTHQALPFSNVGVKGTINGTISNGDGVFTVLVDTIKDLLVVSYLGYETKNISVKQLMKNPVVYLQKSSVGLNEVTVRLNNSDFLYDILSDCRKKIEKDYTEHVSKTYFSLETKRNQYPIELLEAYYNAHLHGINVDELLLKNGKIARDTVGVSYFWTLSTSKALSIINLSNQNNYFPALPLQFSKNKMKRYFKLQLMNSDENYFEIAFEPTEDTNHYFKGRIWVDKSNNLLKIEMQGENMQIYPFASIFPCDTISDFSINVMQTYTHKEGTLMLNHINFDYNFTYKSVRDSTFLHPHIDTNTYSAKGLMYLYDYEQPFILPYFDYDTDMDDYRKIFLIPYNPIFWKNNDNRLLLTEEQNRSLDFFTKHGVVIDYKNKLFNHISHNEYEDSIFNNLAFIKTFTIFWSKNHRLSIIKSIPDSEELAKMEAGQKFIVDLYKLKVQILLDITRVGDSLYHSSYTVFDQYQSFFYLEKKPYSNCFLNIYFDICEVERRKMEEKLPVVGYDLEKIDSIYNQTKIALDKISGQYFSEVQLGENEEMLQKWNDYVNKNLGIDNIKMYSAQMKQEP